MGQYASNAELDDALRVQDDIAGEVTKALKSRPPVTTIDSAPRVYR
jgi:hypothetical protein